MVLKYAKWVLDKDELKGASIFIERGKLTESKVELEESVIMEKLSPYVLASVTYLEFVINEKNSTVNKYLNCAIIIFYIFIAGDFPHSSCNAVS